jgi:ribosomal protein L31
LPEEMSNYKLKIFNDLGNEMNVSSERIQNNIRLDISSLSNGMYLVQVNYDAMLLTKKLLKQ